VTPRYTEKSWQTHVWVWDRHASVLVETLSAVRRPIPETNTLPKETE